MSRFLRWLRGALGNAVVWGAAWFGAGFILGAVLGWPFELRYIRYIVLNGAVPMGLMGAALGGVFAAYISANFRGKRVGDLSPARFAFGGALVPIPFILALAASAQSWKGWIFLGDLFIPVAFVATLGGLTAYSTVKLAQKSLPPGQVPDELEPGTEPLLSQP